jgi:PAS domain S-box-containing protein
MSDANLSREQLLEVLQSLRSRLASCARTEEALRQSEECHRAISELTSDYAYIGRIEGDGTLVLEWASDGFQKVTGYTLDQLEALGGWACLIYPEDLPAAVTRLKYTLEEQQAGSAELRLIRRTGELRWVRYLVRPVLDEPGGRVVRLFGAIQDITERKEAERSLRESSRRITNILESITDGFFALDREGCFTYLNGRAEQLLQRPKEELLGRNVWQAFPEAVGSQFHTQYPSNIASGQASHFEDYYPPLQRWFEVHSYPSPDGMAVYFRDITQRKCAEETLRENARGLRSLSRRLLEVQEQERRHLARELHDEIGQALTGLKFTLEKGAHSPAEELRATLQEAQALLRDVSCRVRDLSLRLRPTMLDDLGLAPALLWLFERFTVQTGVRVAFEHALPPDRFPPAVETAAFRIVQEALTNAARHASVEEVAVRLWMDAAAVGVQVEDHGTGFEAAALAAGRTGGLSGMHERATLLGGRLEIESTLGLGTRVTAELPLHAGPEENAHAADPSAGG